MFIIFLLTLLGGAGLLTLAVWPGVLEDAAFSFPFFLLSLPVLGCWFLLLMGLALWDLAHKPAPSVERRRWGAWSAAIMFATLGLLWLHAPQRVAFALCFPEFRQLADEAPADEFFEESRDQKVGVYRVDRYAGDERGGVFFRTHTGPDGIGPDEMSYGFALRPNRRGTPFGDAKYRRRHLLGDWYAFAASDDW